MPIGSVNPKQGPRTGTIIAADPMSDIVYRSRFNIAIAP